jgi:hypothetical protein
MLSNWDQARVAAARSRAPDEDHVTAPGARLQSYLCLRIIQDVCLHNGWRITLPVTNGNGLSSTPISGCCCGEDASGNNELIMRWLLCLEETRNLCGQTPVSCINVA